MVIRILASDWSGVVSDDRKPVYISNSRLLERYGIDPPSFQEWLDTDASCASEFLIRMGVEEPRGKEYLERTYGEMFSRVQQKTPPELYSDAHKVFQKLNERELPVIVVSSHPEPNLIEEAERYELSPLILRIHSTRDKPGILRTIYKEHSMSPNEVLFIGDTVFDIRSGKAAGVRTAGVATGYHTRGRLENEGPTYPVLGSLSELIDIIDSENGRLGPYNS